MNKLFTILMLIPILLFGQRTKNNVYAEAHLGLFTQFLLNYEKQINFGEKGGLYFRVGGGYGLNHTGWLFSVENQGWGGLVALTALSKLKRKRNQYFEFNMGAFCGYNEERFNWHHNGSEWTYDTNLRAFLSPTLTAGYRYQKPEGGFIFRANAGIISLGLSIGYAF